jgi:5'-nucleotidase
MKRRVVLAGCALALSLSAFGLNGPRQHDLKVKIIAFNDFHGNLLPGSYALGAGQPAIMAGGIDYLAAYVAELRAENPNHVVVSAGDLVGASPLISAFYHDEATIEAMNLLGLDLSAVGNHEFDPGPAELLRKQNGGCYPGRVQTCLEKDAFPGAAFQYLAANVVYTANGKTLFPPYVIKTFQGVRIAFIGVGLRSTPSIVTPQGVSGLTFKDEAETVNALIPELRAQGIHAIVVLIHQGGTQSPLTDPATGGINDCAGGLGGPRHSPIVDVVSRLSDSVDVVISGHTHKAYNCRLPNSAGRLIPVTQAGYYGRLLTDINLSVDSSTGRVTQITASNLVVSQPAADAASSPVHPFLSSPSIDRIRSLIADYTTAVAPLANQVIGTVAAPLTHAAGPSGEEPAGDLIADSEYAATSHAEMGGAVIAFVNPGGVRPPGFDLAQATYPHNITYQEAFAVRPFGNSLVTMTLTAGAIKDLLEQQFPGCNGQTLHRILQVSNGLHVDWSASAPPCQKIVNVTLQAPTGSGPVDRIVDHGEVREPAKTYRVTVDNYLASGGDDLSVLTQGTDRVGGPLDIDALVAYLSATYNSPKAPYDPKDPALNLPRIVRRP